MPTMFRGDDQRRRSRYSGSMGRGTKMELDLPLELQCWLMMMEVGFEKKRMYEMRDD